MTNCFPDAVFFGSIPFLTPSRDFGLISQSIMRSLSASNPGVSMLLQTIFEPSGENTGS